MEGQADRPEADHLEYSKYKCYLLVHSMLTPALLREVTLNLNTTGDCSTIPPQCGSLSRRSLLPSYLA
jgi:hypothetical protein